ncbi:MAG: ferritin family protein [Desulfuromonadales bacterium]|nr:ferritin family protein [Desulfuromonadales bacterium]
MDITAGEILQFAMRMEENGERFYREAATNSSDSRAKELFNRLAAEETVHNRSFEDLFSKADVFEPPESYPGEYLAYFYNYIDNKVFFTQDNKASLPESFDVIKALDFAIQRELDSVLFYQELKAFVPVTDNHTIDAIIEEERRHFAQLCEEKKKLS